jgi:PAS domain-containing protein
MSQARVSTLETDRLTDLRGRAAQQLQGAFASPDAIAGAIDALAVLHNLASTPETASDALMLLHELQVHQVELELQAKELRDSRLELEAALHRQTEIYDHLPLGCFTIDRYGHVLELNATGAEMIALPRAQATGRSLLACLEAEHAVALQAAMRALDAQTASRSDADLAQGAQVARAAAAGTSALGPWPLRMAGRPTQWVWAHLGADAIASRYLLTLGTAAPAPPALAA